ncbi:MAG TPA: hypothetical protein PLH75_13600 [Amaricoccus sp.]|uniref:hypothetical protein n=1 Tax=Amaricoccus sp. TaxID=1872485 RepID=UPI001DA0F120|nr:hypothetical protein [Amaricoccus sp.]MCB1372634.1 hypothetical protein [Paracoccaceae bacterium]MCC0065949.1 hypothetical protein [Rhodovulum sp.]MCB1402273.1 hypothetical protein [Paracoccaceae bacterium]HPG23817.1 hypothetical protein [Amaricoccus sp.]HRW14857.1 hypothetical protein [Amaricoccus sp.]
MPRDTLSSDDRSPSSIRSAVLDLISDRDPAEDDQNFLVALRDVVCRGRTPARDLWQKYRADAPSIRARVYARYGY